MKVVLNNINPFHEGIKKDYLTSRNFVGSVVAQYQNSKFEFVIQKTLAFLILYLLSGIILGAIIIAVNSLFGYNVLNGQMPTGEWVNRIPLYGMAGFAGFTLLYIKVVEKRTLSDIGIVWDARLPIKIIKGIAIGVGLVILAIGVLMILGLCSYQRTGIFSVASCLPWFLAYFIQSFAEEIMCRGFLLTSLSRRIDAKWAILISSIAFTIPHVFTILALPGITMWIAMVNLLLVSWLFSIIMIGENSLGAAGGVHFGWNYCLGAIFGLEVSGGTSSGGLIQFTIHTNSDLLTGGVYGIEASILLIPVLCISIIGYTLLIRRKDNRWNLKRSFMS